MWATRHWSTCALLLACALSSIPCGSSFQEGDFVPIARRGQFKEVRTHWHDLLGRNCPHFGRDRVVAAPIPQPQGHKAVEGYKIMFSVAGDRLYTPWLRIISGSAPQVPMVEFTLTRMGNDIKSVSAQVVHVPDHYLEQHAILTEEWKNDTRWPKHLLLDYKWREEHEVNAVPGMYVLFATALVAGMVLTISALASSANQLRELVDDVVADDAGGVWVPDPSGMGPPVYRAATAPKGD